MNDKIYRNIDVSHNNVEICVSVLIVLLILFSKMSTNCMYQKPAYYELFTIAYYIFHNKYIYFHRICYTHGSEDFYFTKMHEIR